MNGQSTHPAEQYGQEQSIISKVELSIGEPDEMCKLPSNHFVIGFTNSQGNERFLEWTKNENGWTQRYLQNRTLIGIAFPSGYTVSCVPYNQYLVCSIQTAQGKVINNVLPGGVTVYM